MRCARPWAAGYRPAGDVPGPGIRASRMARVRSATDGPRVNFTSRVDGPGPHAAVPELVWMLTPGCPQIGIPFFLQMVMEDPRRRRLMTKQRIAGLHGRHGLPTLAHRSGPARLNLRAHRGEGGHKRFFRFGAGNLISDIVPGTPKCVQEFSDSDVDLFCNQVPVGIA